MRTIYDIKNVPTRPAAGAGSPGNTVFMFPRRAILAAFLAAALLAVLLFASTAAAETPAVSTGIKPERYRVTIDLYPERHMVSGEVEIETRILPEFTGEITLNLNRDMDVRSVLFLPDGYEVAFRREGDSVFISAGDRTPGIIYVSFYGDPSVYITPKNSFTYIGNEGCYLSDQCCYFARIGVDDESHCEMTVSMPEKWEAVTQGKKVYEYSKGGRTARTTQVFRTIARTRCHTLAAGPYSMNSVELYGSNFKIWSYFLDFDKEYAANHLNEAESILKFYSNSFGGFKPGSMLKIVEVEKVFPGGYGPEEVVYITASAISGGTVDVELLAHEIAHQWFGNLVMGEFPESNFLNEAFATYASLRYLASKPEHYERYLATRDSFERQYFAYRQAAGTAEASLEGFCRAPGRMPGYQEVVYYRGAFVLGMLLNEVEKAASLSTLDILKKYVSEYPKKIVTMKEFENFLFGENSPVYYSWNESRVKAVRDVYESFYRGTAAVEIVVKDYSAAGTPGGTACAFEIERVDGFPRPVPAEIVFYDRSGKAVEKKLFTLESGLKKYNFNLKISPAYWEIDPDRKILMKRYFPAILALDDDTGEVVVYGTASPSSKVNAFMKELAASISPSSVADFQFDAAKVYGGRKILFIGTPKNNRALGNLENRLPFKYFDHSISLEGVPYPDENYAARYCFRNPFMKFGVIGVVSFESEASLSDAGRLGPGLSDYVIILPTLSRVIRGNFKSGISGRFFPEGGDDATGIEISSISAGFGGLVVENRTNPFQVFLSSNCPDTKSVQLKVLHSRDANELIIQKKLEVAPNCVSRFEYPFSASSGSRGQLIVSIADEAGRKIGEEIVKYRYTRPSFVYLLVTDERGNIGKFNSALGSTFSTLFKNRSVMELIPVSHTELPKDSLLLSAVTGILFFDADMAGMPKHVPATLENFAAAGGRVIFSGYDFSRDARGANAEFFEKHFAHRISSSTTALIPGEPNAGAGGHISRTAPVACHAQVPKPAAGSGGGNAGAVRRRDGLLLESRTGRGSMFYIPYDFMATELRYNKFNDELIAEAFVNQGRWPREFIDPARLDIEGSYRQNVEGSLRWEYFLIFMFAYFMTLGPAVGIYLHGRNRMDYYFNGMAAVTIAFSLLVVASGTFLRNSGNSIEAICIAELPFDFSGKLVRNNYFSVRCGNYDKISVEFPGMELVGSSYSPYSSATKANIVDGARGSLVNIMKPLAFVPNIFSISESAPLAAGAGRYGISGDFGARELTVRFNAPFLAGASAAGGKKTFATAILKLPHGFYASKIGSAAGEIRVPYSDVGPPTQDTFDRFFETADLSATEKNALMEVVKQLNQHYTHREAPVMIYVFRDELDSVSDMGEKRVGRLNIFVSPFTFAAKRGSVIPDFMFLKKNFKNRGMNFIDCTFSAENLVESKNGEFRPAFALKAKFEYVPKTRKFIFPKIVTQKLASSAYVDELGCSEKNITLDVKPEKLTAEFSDFGENIVNNKGMSGPLAVAFRAPHFDDCGTDFSLICE